MNENIEDETGKDAVAGHFGSKAEGFSNPNIAPKVAEKIEVANTDTVEEDSKDAEEKPFTYNERLEKLKITAEDAHNIIDDICEKGSYMEAAIIRKAREGKKEVKAVFLTRDTRSQSFIAIEAAKKHNNIPMIFEKIMGEMQLAASLLHFNGDSFEPLSKLDTDEDFETEIMRRVQLFSKLPAPITVVLQRKLGDFDLKVTAVMAPGYEDFF